MHELQNLISLFHGNILGGHHPNNVNLPDLFLVSLIYFLSQIFKVLLVNFSI